jgi:diguanylate cyclase (GGDEF)-like protein
MTNALIPDNDQEAASSLLPVVQKEGIGAGAAETDYMMRRGSAPLSSPSIQQALLQAHMDLIISRREIALLNANNAELRRQLANAVQQEAEARVYAYRDELTGLPNRRLLSDRFQQAVALAERHGTLAALLLIDLDGFKQINDTLGHSAGDQLLRQVASRLKICTRSIDTASRYGGDEFVVLLPDLDGYKAIETVITRIQTCLNTPYLLNGHQTPATASIGCAVYPDDGDNSHDLLERADAAMYRAKAQRRHDAQVLATEEGE